MSKNSFQTVSFSRFHVSVIFEWYRENCLKVSKTYYIFIEIIIGSFLCQIFANVTETNSYEPLKLSLLSIASFSSAQLIYFFKNVATIFRANLILRIDLNVMFNFHSQLIYKSQILIEV